MAINKATLAKEVDGVTEFIYPKTSADMVEYDANQSVAEKIASMEESIPDSIPKKTSDLTNDSGFIKNTVSDLVNYYKKSETYTQAEINNLVGQIPKFSIQVVSTLPTTGISATTVYLVKENDDTGNLYTEYIYVNSKWEILGSQKVDLTGYAKTADIPTKTSQLTNDSNFATTNDLNTAISNLQAGIPTKLSQFTNDPGFITKTVTDLVNYYDKTTIDGKFTSLSSDIENTNNAYQNKFSEINIDISEINNEIQNKFVTLESEIIQQTPLFANSIGELEESGDKSKVYVLPDGYIYAYMYYKSDAGITNLFDPNSVSLNTRYTGSPGTEVTNAKGNLCTDYLPVDMNITDEYGRVILTLLSNSGIGAGSTYPMYQKIAFFDSNKECLGSSYYSADMFTNDSNNYKRNFIIGVLSDGSKASYYDDIRYVRIIISINGDGIALTEFDEDLITSIYNPNDISQETGYKWINTGYAFIPTDYEDRIIKLEESINNTTINTNLIPSYWKTAINNLSDSIKEKLDNYGNDALSFIWAADIHGINGYTNSNGAGTSVTKNIGYICQYASEKYNIPFILFSGDIMSQSCYTNVSSVFAEYNNLNVILQPIDKEKLLIEKGNHDGAWGAPVDNVYYLKNIGNKQIYNILFRRQAMDRQRVFGKDGLYYYIDYHGFRIIMLNGHTDGDGSNDGNGYAVYNSMKTGVYGSEQLKWLAEVALNVPENTKIIISAHQPFTNADGELLAGILEAYNNRTSYNKSVDISNEYWGNGVTDNTYKLSSIDCNFNDAKGKVLAFFHGHIHKDTIDSTTYSFVVASITTAGGDVRDSNPPIRTSNTATETALDIVIIALDKIYFIRLGAGEDRVIEIK